MTAGRLEVRLRYRFTRLHLDTELEVGTETVALIGPSGAGKSSVLRCVAGLLSPGEGRVAFDGEPWFDSGAGVDLPPAGRRVGMVFQDDALFPHLSVERNVAFGPRRAGRSRTDALRLARGTLGRFGISRLATARPGTLSGGERRRVALARAVAADPAVLLLDEPLTGLDPATKAEVAAELHGHLRRLALPAILVSHDVGDVLGLADRIAVLEAGRIVQEGAPAQLLEAPRTPFVAAFTGANYFLGTASLRGELTQVLAAEGARFLSTDAATGPVGVVVHPWDVSLAAVRSFASALNELTGPIVRMAPLGNRVRVTVGSRPAIVAEVTADSSARMGLAPGRQIVATWKATGTRLVASPSVDDGGA
ncbi:MAG TPA: ABC transporter ATP-binding protein [Actinobacteria bacterium]|jgi:molybdate transport system ATP-binding protein|nr:ABC transporter ATP-binding protein [Actinomycetota bacterium]